MPAGHINSASVTMNKMHDIAQRTQRPHRHHQGHAVSCPAASHLQSVSNSHVCTWQCCRHITHQRCQHNIAAPCMHAEPKNRAIPHPCAAWLAKSHASAVPFPGCVLLHPNPSHGPALAPTAHPAPYWSFSRLASACLRRRSVRAVLALLYMELAPRAPATSTMKMVRLRQSAGVRAMPSVA